MRCAKVTPNPAPGYNEPIRLTCPPKFTRDETHGILILLGIWLEDLVIGEILGHAVSSVLHTNRNDRCRHGGFVTFWQVVLSGNIFANQRDVASLGSLACIEQELVHRAIMNM